MHDSASKPSAPPAPHWKFFLLAFGALTFTGYFFQFWKFGFYGDEHAFFGGMVNRTWSAEWQNFQFCLTKWPQGRPLGMGFNLSLLPFSIYQFGGLPALHFAAGGFVVVSATLIFVLLRPRLGPSAAFVAGGFYCLAPADTVALSLVYSFNFEIAIICSLLATFCAVRGRWFAYGLPLAACLLMVEPVAMVALFFPLALTYQPDRTWLRRAALNVVLWIGVVGLVLVLRNAIGDPWGSERVGELGRAPLLTLQRGFESALTGTWTHWALVGARVVAAWRELDFAVIFSIILAAGVAWRTLARLFGGEEACDRRARLEFAVLGLAGVVMMAATYFCYFRSPWHPANWKTGFMSGVHVISAVSSSLVVGVIAAVLLQSWSGRVHRFVAVVAAVMLGSLAAFGNLVQRDYIASWDFQKRFWRAYTELCRDAGEGTYVLILDRNLPHPRFIDVFSWGTEILPEALFSYRNPPPRPPRTVTAAGTQAGGPISTPPAALKRPPVVIVNAPEVATAISFDGQHYAWKATHYFTLPKKPEERPEAGNVIALYFGLDGEWHRLEGEQPVDGGTLRLKPATDPAVLAGGQRSSLARVYGL